MKLLNLFYLLLPLFMSCSTSEKRKDIAIPVDNSYHLTSIPKVNKELKTLNATLLRKDMRKEADNLKYRPVQSEILGRDLSFLSNEPIGVMDYPDREVFKIVLSNSTAPIFCTLKKQFSQDKVEGKAIVRYFSIDKGIQHTNKDMVTETRFKNKKIFKEIGYSNRIGSTGYWSFAKAYTIYNDKDPIRPMGCYFLGYGNRNTLKRIVEEFEDQVMNDTKLAYKK